jgi:hypothetical protein
MIRYALLAALSLCCISVSARDAEGAKNGVVEKAVLADTPESFTAQTERIHDEMQAGGRYEFANASARAKVDVLLAKMASLLQEAGSVDAMKHDNKVALFNSQEEVNGILKHNDSNRLVCESRAPVGSHIPLTTCRTFGEIEHIRRTSKNALDDMADANRAQTTNGVNGCLTGERQYCPGQNGAGAGRSR